MSAIIDHFASRTIPTDEWDEVGTATSNTICQCGSHIPQGQQCAYISHSVDNGFALVDEVAYALCRDCYVQFLGVH
jgi:hypothetical protein